MATIRELFHSLGNDHNLVTVGAGVTQELVDECFEIKEIPEELKDKLDEIRKNLEHVAKNAMEADKKTREIHNRVYAVIDPDTGKPK